MLAPDSRTARNTGSPTAIAMSYFSPLRPYVPATPQHTASTCRASRPGTSAISSSAGVPMPWPRCWHGAW